MDKRTVLDRDALLVVLVGLSEALSDALLVARAVVGAEAEIVSFRD